MEFKSALKLLLLLLLMLSRPAHGQNQQTSQSKFLPDIFGSIQTKLGSFNRFSYISRPMGHFPATGYHHPSELNFAYVHPLVQPVPVVHFNRPTRTRQNVLLPTSLSGSDNVGQQMSPPMQPLHSDTVVSAPPPLAVLPLSPDNRRFQDRRFIQPTSFAISENNGKDIIGEKSHKPVYTDTAFENNNIRKSVTKAVVTPSITDNTLIKHKYQRGSQNSDTIFLNTKFYNVSGQSTQTRLPPHVSKERRRPFGGFKPIVSQTKTHPTRKPELPQHAEAHNHLPEVFKANNKIHFEEKNPSTYSAVSKSDVSLLPGVGVSQSVSVTPADDTIKGLTVLEEEKVVHAVMEDSAASFRPEKESDTITERTPDVHSASADGESEEYLLGKTTESSVPPEKQPLVRKVPSPVPKEKSSMPPSELNSSDDTSSTSNLALRDSQVLTGTPEEILSLKLADAINNFGFGLYRKLQETNNLFFSPFSLSEALAIVLEGASNMTALQMMSTLHFTESNIRLDEVKSGFKSLMKSLKSKRSNYQFENANLLLLRSKFFFKGDFSNSVYRYYKPLLGSVDFAADGLNIKRSVNDWVKRKTHDKIDELLTEPLPSDTVFVVLNAVYFRGRWIHPFDPTLTGPAPFYNFGKDPVEITMMKLIGTFAVGYSASLKSQIIELPYEGEETSMVLLLPEEHDGIYQLRNSLNYQELYVILSAIDFQLVELCLPRFSLQSRYDMEDVLKEMGMRDVLIPGKANLGRMTNVPGLYLSKVFQESVVDVDEKGTEAAASTGGIVLPLSRPRAFTVDHPFFFFIRNRNNGAILFIGQFDAFDA